MVSLSLSVTPRKEWQTALSISLIIFPQTPVLRALSAIDPEILPKQEAISYIKQLPSLINVLTDEEQDTYNRELIRFSQAKLPRETDCYDRPIPVDQWWGEVFSNNKFPTMLKVLTPALGLFTGPLVKNTFSEIQNYVTDKQNCLNGETLL